MKGSWNTCAWFQVPTLLPFVLFWILQPCILAAQILLRCLLFDLLDTWLLPYILHKSVPRCACRRWDYQNDITWPNRAVFICLCARYPGLQCHDRHSLGASAQSPCFSSKPSQFLVTQWIHCRSEPTSYEGLEIPFPCAIIMNSKPSTCTVYHSRICHPKENAPIQVPNCQSALKLLNFTELLNLCDLRGSEPSTKN